MDNEHNNLTMEDLGYGEFFEAGRQHCGFGGFAVARVIAEYKELYRVKNLKGEYSAKITGKQMFHAASRQDYPATGDWVAITELNDEQAVIEGILPRKTMIKRKASGKNEVQIIATNIDVAFAVQAVDADYSLNRFERYFAIANDGGVLPAIILNKTDLISKEELDSKIIQIKDRFGDIDVIAASTINDAGMDALKKYIASPPAGRASPSGGGKTYCFLGSSGVGKSSLINKLIGKEAIKTNDISARTDRGKHTTTGREMYFLQNGSIVIDNPGMREVGMADAGAGIDDIFGQITGLAKGCKYGDCTHTQEPGCRVLAAVESGELDGEKYRNYLGLKKEAEFYAMNDVQKRKKDRQFGKFIKRTKEQLKKSDRQSH